MKIDRAQTSLLDEIIVDNFAGGGRSEQKGVAAVREVRALRMRAYRLPVRGSGRQGTRRSPAKRVRWGEDEQRNVRMFGAKRRTEQNGVCEDEKPLLVRRANFGYRNMRPIPAEAAHGSFGRTESSAPTGTVVFGRRAEVVAPYGC